LRQNDEAAYLAGVLWDLVQAGGLILTRNKQLWLNMVPYRNPWPYYSLHREGWTLVVCCHAATIGSKKVSSQSGQAQGAISAFADILRIQTK
jgi:hypothetical protein